MALNIRDRGPFESSQWIQLKRVSIVSFWAVTVCVVDTGLDSVHIVRIYHSDHMPGGPGHTAGSAGEGGQGGLTKQTVNSKRCNKPPGHAQQFGHWLWRWKKVDFHNDGVPSPLPLPTLYCISQASPIMGFTLRPVTRGGGPAPLLTMAPWGPRRLRCCTVSMPPPPATPPSSTYTARISLRTQVCICASISYTFWTFQFDSWHFSMVQTFI